MLLLNLLLIGLAVTVNPIPLTAFLIVLPSERGVLKGAAYTFGWLVSLAIVVSVTVLATGDNPPRPATVPSLAALALKLAIGLVLLEVAWRRVKARGRPKPPKKTPKWQERVDSMSPWFAMGLGVLLQPWGLIAVGAATVMEAKLSSWESYVALFFFCLIASSSYLAIEIYSLVRPEQSRAFLVKTRTWIDTHTDQAIIIGSLLLGLWLVANSIYLLVSS